MYRKTQVFCTLVGLLVAGASFADVSITIHRYGHYLLDIKVTVDGELMCDENMNVPQINDYSSTTVCSVDLSGASQLHIAGDIKSQDETGKFESTFSLMDMDPFTKVLRDPSLDFGTRLDQHYENLLALDPDIADWIRFDRPDISQADVEQALGADVMAAMPPEMKALITRNITIGDVSYLSPAHVHRSGVAPRWPDLSETERAGGRPEGDLPKVGTELRDWYDRVLVVYEMYGDGLTTVVWDPIAAAPDPAFFWLDEDTRDVSPFVYPNGTSASALDVLLIPYESMSFRYLTEDGPAWLREAGKVQGITDLDSVSYFYLVEPSNPHAELSLSFAQNSTMPFFKTVEPDVELYLSTWWRN